MELVDTTDSKSVALRRAGSIPANPTICFLILKDSYGEVAMLQLI